jgi:hypothetical protein
MTALAAQRDVSFTGDSPLAKFIDLPVLASVKIYAGAGVVIDSAGYAKPAVTATGLTTAGVAQETADNTGGASGAIRVRVRTGTAGPFAITGLAQSDLGRTTLYWTDDQTVTATSSGRSIAGIAMPHPSGSNVSTEAYVAMPGPAHQSSIGTNSALSGNTPAGPGTGAAGAAADVSKSDHVHPPVEDAFRIQDAAANTATTETVIFRFQNATTISAVKFVADASVVQSDTDYATMTVKQGDGAGGARSTVASATSKVTGGINMVAFTAVSLGALTNAVVPAGGIVTLTVTKSGAGKALAGCFVLEFSLPTLAAASE